VSSVWRVFLGGLILAMLGAGAASAQNIDFNLLLTPQTGQPGTILNDTTVNIVGQVGTQSQVSITATYTGSTAATIAAKPQLIGSTEFTTAIVSTTTGSTALPIVLGPGQSFTFTVTFTPTSASPASAQVQVFYTEPGTTGTPVQSSITLPFTGSAPSFTLSYILQSTNNGVTITSGQAIPFGSTQINTTANANLYITNSGSGPGGISGITWTGSPIFKVQGIPPISTQQPYQLAAGTALQLLVTYTPTAVESDTGQIQITYQDGSSATVNLTGSGIASTFSYKYLVQGTSTTVAPGGTITFPGANVGSTSSLIVQVTNTGSATGTIGSISTNPPFTLTNPVTLPATITSGNSFSVPLTFTPTAVGAQKGQLLIGNDFFTLTGQGQGSSLTYGYTSTAGTFTVNPATGGAVIFTPTAIGSSEKVTFTITNGGTSSATISNISTAAPFSLTPPPTLPLTLNAGQSSQFSITFTPTTVTTTTGNLQIDTTQVQLMGSGTAPPALPSYTIGGPSGDASPASQTPVSLTLASSYPVDLDGVLTLTTSGNLGTDQSVQFSTSGRTVDFVIPANSTSANFAGQGSQIYLQTGTVAETVMLAPTFTTTAGVDVTPASTTLTFTIPSIAPVEESIQVTSTTASGFVLVIQGYSTTRSLTTLNVTFNPAPGYNLATSQFPIPLTSAAAVWFQSSSAQSFGGLFSISVPFNLSGTVPATKTLLDTIASVSATVSNSVGASNSLLANVQ
jgi:hypothetical protein